ncbi:MAG: HlyD family efflux transporter periplasmic adaptor subunit [Mangrovibacterium sp.]
MPQHSEEVQEIIGKSPSWLLRSGQLILLVAVLLLLLGSWLFRYPDVIYGRVVVLSENPPAHLVARATGRIVKLPVNDRQPVDSGQVLAVMESAAQPEDVRCLKNELKAAARFFERFDTLDAVSPAQAYRLGEMQAVYSVFLRLYSNYLSFVRLGFYPRRISALGRQVEMQGVYRERLQIQQQILARDFGLAREQFVRDSLLYIQQVLSWSDYRDSESAALEKQFDLSEVRTLIAGTQREILALKQERVTAEKEYAEQKNRLQTELTTAFQELKSGLASWEKTYLLKAPVSGTVTFTHIWSMNQQVREGEPVFSVVPQNQGKLVGRLTLPMKGAGKVCEGQRVNIRFDNFPHLEYGMVKGLICSVSLVPSQDTYTVEIGLPDGLVTNYNRILPFSQEMQGDVEIITEEQRLLQRFLNPLRSLLNHRISE